MWNISEFLWHSRWYIVTTKLPTVTHILHSTQHVRTIYLHIHHQIFFRLLRFLHIISCEQVVNSCDLNGSHGPPVTTDVILKGVHERTQRVMYFYGRRTGQWWRLNLCAVTKHKRLWRVIKGLENGKEELIFMVLLSTVCNPDNIVPISLLAKKINVSL
jgi:hypothetical protein